MAHGKQEGSNLKRLLADFTVKNESTVLVQKNMTFIQDCALTYCPLQDKYEPAFPHMCEEGCTLEATFCHC